MSRRSRFSAGHQATWLRKLFKRQNFAALQLIFTHQVSFYSHSSAGSSPTEARMIKSFTPKLALEIWLCRTTCRLARDKSSLSACRWMRMIVLRRRIYMRTPGFRTTSTSAQRPTRASSPTQVGRATEPSKLQARDTPKTRLSRTRSSANLKLRQVPIGRQLTTT